MPIIIFPYRSVQTAIVSSTELRIPKNAAVSVGKDSSANHPETADSESSKSGSYDKYVL